MNGDNWYPDQKYVVEVNEAFDRAKYELNYGILTKYKQLRMK